MNRKASFFATIALVAFAASQPVLGQAPPPPPPSAMGHSLSTQTLQFLSYTGDIEGQVEFPVAGRIKIADNTSPLPRDRVYYLYNHFHNAFDVTVVDLINGNPTVRSISMERHTVGMEQTMGDYFSVELRLPIFTQSFAGDAHPDIVPGNGTVGNLSVITKSVLFVTETGAVSSGMAITAPTGDDVSYSVSGETLLMKNEAVHMTPYVAVVGTPTSRMFWQSFAEIDFALNGNSAEFYTGGPVAAQSLGVVDPQTVLCADISLGYWLYQPNTPNPWTAQGFGLASILEFSYLTALEDADKVCGTTNTGNTDFNFGNARNRFDVIVSTLGLHAQLGDNSTLRVGAVVPLTDGTDRFFDSEIIFQFNRRF